MRLTIWVFLALMVSDAVATMTASEQLLVVDRHNKVRSQTAQKKDMPTGNADHIPCTATDMEKMVWDPTLGTSAQTYSAGCVGDHPPEAGTDFGENIWMLIDSVDYTSTDLETGVQEWYDEIVDTVWDISATSGPSSKPLAQCKTGSTTGGPACNVGHYYQVIWASSSKIGCGVTACSSGLTFGGTQYTKGVLMVCRYLSPGMNNGAGGTVQSPFIFGKPCAGCVDACTDGLCTSAPTRCVDKIGWSLDVGGTTYTTCAAVIAGRPAGQDWCTQLAAFVNSEDKCRKSCNLCTVPANVGSSHCVAASGTTGSGSGSTSSSGSGSSSSTSSSNNGSTNSSNSTGNGTGAGKKGTTSAAKPGSAIGLASMAMVASLLWGLYVAA